MRTWRWRRVLNWRRRVRKGKLYVTEEFGPLGNRTSTPRQEWSTGSHGTGLAPHQCSERQRRSRLRRPVGTDLVRSWNAEDGAGRWTETCDHNGRGTRACSRRTGRTLYWRATHRRGHRHRSRRIISGHSVRPRTSRRHHDAKRILRRRTANRRGVIDLETRPYGRLTTDSGTLRRRLTRSVDVGLNSRRKSRCGYQNVSANW